MHVVLGADSPNICGQALNKGEALHLAAHLERERPNTNSLLFHNKKANRKSLSEGYAETMPCVYKLGKNKRR